MFPNLPHCRAVFPHEKTLIHPSMFNFVSCDSLLCRWNASCVTSFLRWRHFRAHVVVPHCSLFNLVTGVRDTDAKHQMRNTGCVTPMRDTWRETPNARHRMRDTRARDRWCGYSQRMASVLEIEGFKMLVGILSRHGTESFSLPSHLVSIPHSNDVCPLTMT